MDKYFASFKAESFIPRFAKAWHPSNFIHFWNWNTSLKASILLNKMFSCFIFTLFCVWIFYEVILFLSNLKHEHLPLLKRKKIRKQMDKLIFLADRMRERLSVRDFIIARVMKQGNQNFYMVNCLILVRLYKIRYHKLHYVAHLITFHQKC